MCTVTFIPVNNNVFLTSNRDEKLQRPKAVRPQVYPFSSGNILFPKDGQYGGTWIAVNENGNAVVLLNGAFNAHVPAPPYRKSRGLILLDLIDHFTPYNSFLAVNLNLIEPFTVIIYEDGRLFECRWDGRTKHYKQIDEKTPHIWSSVTLYNKEIIRKREGWFAKWSQENPFPSAEQILKFHQGAGEDDHRNGLCMNRDEVIKTLSISLIELTHSDISMTYLDLYDKQQYHHSMVIEKTTIGG